MSKLYFDLLKIKRRVDVTEGEYTLVYYEDKFAGHSFGNMNLVKNEESLLHQTTIRKKWKPEQLKERLKTMVEQYEKKQFDEMLKESDVLAMSVCRGKTNED